MFARLRAPLTAVALLCAAGVAFAQTDSGNSQTEAARPLTAAQQQVVATVSRIFDAATKDDTAEFASVTTPGFYLFDGGRRFDGDAILGLIAKQQAAGFRYVWKVTEPDVHIAGKMAWIAYVNRGSVTDASGTTKDVTWLESGVLEQQKGGWKIEFLHSTRAVLPLTSQR